MSEIKRNLKTKAQTIVSAGQSVQSGIQLNANPDFSRVFDTQDNLLAEMLPGERFVCPVAEAGATDPTDPSDCVQSDIVPAWLIADTNNIWGVKPEATYFALIFDTAFIAVLLDEIPTAIRPYPNATHCKDITWDVQSAPVFTGQPSLDFDGVGDSEYLNYGGTFVWLGATTKLVLKIQAMLAGEVVGRELRIEFA